MSGDVIGLPAREPERFIDRQELAELMGVSVDSIDRLVREGMPSVTRGKRTRRFRASTAIAWASARVQQDDAA